MNVEHASFLIGKILLTGYFVLRGLNHIVKTQEIETIIKNNYVPEKALNYVIGLTLIFASLMILVGVYPILGITFIVGYLITVNVNSNDFWNKQGGRGSEKEDFLVNVALIGGMLMLINADWTVYGLGMTLGLI